MMKTIAVLAIVILLFCLYHQVLGQQIKLYSGTGFEGTKKIVNISLCSNLQLDFKVSSVNTQDNCARLWNEKNCGGNSIEVMRRSPSHGNLGDWDFGNKTLSVGPCRDSCDVEVTGIQPTEPFLVTINFRNASDSDHKETLTLNISGCTALPPRFQDKVQSVETSGQCVQLWSTSNCVSTKSGDDTVELRKGTPKHNEIKTAWVIRTVRAVSHCRYKCSDKSRKSAMLDETVTNGSKLDSDEESSEDSDSNSDESIEYTNETNVTEPYITILVHKKRFNAGIATCTNLPLSLHTQYSVNSVNTRNYCARLWSGKNCSANSIEVQPRSPSHGNLRKWNFQDRTVSVGSCRDPCDLGVTGMQPSEPFQVEIYSGLDFLSDLDHHKYLTLHVDGCAQVPTYFQKYVHSVRTFGYCVQLWSTSNCVTEKQGDDTVELRRGTPGHGNIQRDWLIRTVKAISHCRYKCNDNDTKMVPKTVPSKIETSTTPTEEYLVLIPISMALLGIILGVVVYFIIEKTLVRLFVDISLNQQVL